MTRKKLPISYIADDAIRKTTFMKRKKGLIKKASELSILCDVDVGLVIYSPYNPEPDVWPSRNGALDVFNRFNNLPEMQRGKMMTNMTSFTQQQIKRLRDQIDRQRRMNARQAMETHIHASRAGVRNMHDFDPSRYGSSTSFLISEAIRSVKSKMELVKEGQQRYDPAIQSALNWSTTDFLFGNK